MRAGDRLSPARPRAYPCSSASRARVPVSVTPISDALSPATTAHGAERAAAAIAELL